MSNLYKIETESHRYMSWHLRADSPEAAQQKFYAQHKGWADLLESIDPEFVIRAVLAEQLPEDVLRNEWYDQAEKHHARIDAALNHYEASTGLPVADTKLFLCHQHNLAGDTVGYRNLKQEVFAAAADFDTSFKFIRYRTDQLGTDVAYEGVSFQLNNVRYTYFIHLHSNSIVMWEALNVGADGAVETGSFESVYAAVAYSVKHSQEN